MLIELNPIVALHWRRWGDEWVVFDAGSGQTHQMDTLPSVTLICLEEGPADFQELLNRVADILSIPADEQLEIALNGIIEQFSSLGLLLPASE